MGTVADLLEDLDVGAAGRVWRAGVVRPLVAAKYVLEPVLGLDVLLGTDDAVAYIDREVVHDTHRIGFREES